MGEKIETALRKNLDMCHEVGWILVLRLSFRGMMDLIASGNGIEE
jgi:hypothetical protein